MVCCIQQSRSVGYMNLSERFSLTIALCSLFLLFSSFTFLSFTLPAPQGARKAMTQPARVTAFSFCLCYRRPDHLNALRFTLGIFSGKLFFYCKQASPAELACLLFHGKGSWRVAASAGVRSPAGSCRAATEGP